MTRVSLSGFLIGSLLTGALGLAAFAQSRPPEQDSEDDSLLVFGPSHSLLKSAD